MKLADQLNTIVDTEVTGPFLLKITWSNGFDVEIDLAATAKLEPFRSFREPGVFKSVTIGEWGHSLVWPGDVEMSADALWLDTLATIGRDDARTFLKWRLRHGLSIERAAAALELSERDVARYSNASAPVPKTVLLACRGWEALQAA